ncbi:unnamed protein product [Effrenium voratum]|nr:unnamed protein product [Effrenium voratum]
MDSSDSPPMIWAPHTVTPEIRPHNAVVESGSLVSSLMELGLDGIVSGEPQGQLLALTLRMWVHKLEMAAETVSDVMYERKRRAHNVEYYKAHTESLLWDYLRHRIAPIIPPCDSHLPSGVLDCIDGWSFGSCRRTANGAVYRLNRRRDNALVSGTRESAFLVDKENIRDVTGMMVLKRMVDALWMVSCDKWQHPNIQRLFQIYHSPSYIIMRMEYAGASSLHERLVRRSRRPLSFLKTSQILQQIFRGVSHLHLGPRVCHRDIKPENFDLHETADLLTLKLTGFHLAFVLEEGECQQRCGTVPFVAPEVLKNERYHPLPVDIWGVGITVLEILCGSRCVDEAMGLSEEGSKAYRRPDDAMLKSSVEVFGEPGSAGQMLQARCLAELQGFTALTPLVNSLLTMEPEGRATAADLALAAENLPKGTPTAPPLSPLPQLPTDQEDSQSVQWLDETHGNISEAEVLEEPEAEASRLLQRNESAKTAGTLQGPGLPH